jgi:PTS system nitrogen regulatory IIA component
MADEDFDIASLAAYLHLTPAQVSKLADRGKLPGRRIGGVWRFSGPEIHHWLEERIGLSDEVELVQMEGVLQRAAPDGQDDDICLAELLPPEAIAVPLAARTRSRVIEGMAMVAAETGWLWDPPKLAEAVRQREEMHPTAQAGGLALLHPRRPMPTILGQAFLSLGITSSGIPFGGERRGMTDIFFLILSVDEQGHLRTLARLSRLVGLPDFLDQLRSAEDASAAHRLIAQREQELD